MVADRNDGGPIDTEFLHRLVRKLDIGRFFHIAADGLATDLGADGAAVIVCEAPERLRYRFFHGLPARYQSSDLLLSTDRRDHIRRGPALLAPSGSWAFIAAAVHGGFEARL
jgi:hypothetical protein